MLFSGIDWADKEFVIVITDEQGKVVKNLIVKNNVKGFEDFIEKVRTVTSDLDWLIPAGAPQTEAFTLFSRVDGNTDASKILTNETAAIITFDEPAVNTWQAGLTFPELRTDGAQVIIQLMPFESPDFVPLFGELKRIFESWISFIETAHAIVNGQEVSFRELGVSAFDVPNPVTTVRYRNDGMLGFDREASFEITQDQPFPMEIAGVGLKVKV